MIIPEKGMKSKSPRIDPAEDNAFFPSDYSLDEFTSSVTDLSDYEYPAPYQGARKVLVIAADERYLLMDNGSLFSTGNHPVETLVPMYHMSAAGFDFEIATLSGNMAKFEFWAMPSLDDKIIPFYERFREAFRHPRKLPEITAGLTNESEYAAIFIPGGHGALIAMSESQSVAETLRWAMSNGRFVISLCHGPAAFLSLRDGENPLRGYSICAFPDSMDKQTPDIGYMPGHLTWYFGEKLRGMGINIVNDDITGSVHKDCNVLTGDSPFAANALGRLAATELLAAYAV